MTLTNQSHGLVKLDANGNYSGGITLSDDVRMEHVKILSDKSILIAGTLDGGGGDVDPGPGIVNINPSTGAKHIFILKLDSAFNFADVKIIETLDTLWLYNPLVLTDFNVDAMGSLYISGKFLGEIDFDPGPGQYLQNYIPPGGQPYDVYSQGKYFVVKLNSAMDLDKVSFFSTKLQSLSVTDPFNNIYLYGECKGNVDMDPGPGVTLINNTITNDVFYIAKYDSLFNLVWVKSTENDYLSSSTLRYGKNQSLNLVCYLYDSLGSNGFGIHQYDCDYSNGSEFYTFFVNLDTSGIAKQSINLGKSYSIGSTACIYGTQNNFYMSGRISDVTDIEAGPGITLKGAFPNSSYNFLYPITAPTHTSAKSEEMPLLIKMVTTLKMLMKAVRKD
ncbi:MAG: hypothetical protein IPP71_02785 [Bacteroidetes bacterium]|nr:hypothetical protein [Bacteroidota bacterium]